MLDEPTIRQLIAQTVNRPPDTIQDHLVKRISQDLAKGCLCVQFSTNLSDSVLGTLLIRYAHLLNFLYEQDHLKGNPKFL